MSGISRIVCHIKCDGKGCQKHVEYDDWIINFDSLTEGRNSDLYSESEWKTIGDEDRCPDHWTFGDEDVDGDLDIVAVD